MLARPLAVLAIGLLSVTAAQAATSCYATSPGARVSFGVTIGVGEEFTEDDRNKFDLMQLRQMGVDATRVEQWGGCIRAYVRKAEGGEEMQFFHPETFERIYLD